MLILYRLGWYIIPRPPLLPHPPMYCEEVCGRHSPHYEGARYSTAGVLHEAVAVGAREVEVNVTPLCRCVAPCM
jgi:hypothetical protein